MHRDIRSLRVHLRCHAALENLPWLRKLDHYTRPNMHKIIYKTAWTPLQPQKQSPEARESDPRLLREGLIPDVAAQTANAKGILKQFFTCKGYCHAVSRYRGQRRILASGTYKQENEMITSGLRLPGLENILLAALNQLILQHPGPEQKPCSQKARDGPQSPPVDVLWCWLCWAASGASSKTKPSSRLKQKQQIGAHFRGFDSPKSAKPKT